MSNELRIGVIGTSQRGKLADHAHKPGEGSRVVTGGDIEKTATNPIAARMAVAAGCAATESLRSDSRCIEIPPLDQTILDYFG